MKTIRMFATILLCAAAFASASATIAAQNSNKNATPPNAKAAQNTNTNQETSATAKKSSVALGKGADSREFHLSGEVILLYCLVPSRTSRSKVWFMNLSRSSLLARSTLANSSWARFKSPFLR